MMCDIMRPTREVHGALMLPRGQALLLLGLVSEALSAMITNDAAARLFDSSAVILQSSLDRVAWGAADGCVVCGGRLCKSSSSFWVSRI